MVPCAKTGKTMLVATPQQVPALMSPDPCASKAAAAPPPTAVKAVPASSRVPQTGPVAAAPKAEQPQLKPNPPSPEKPKPEAKQPIPEKSKEVNAPVQPEKPNPEAQKPDDCKTQEQKMLLAMQEKIKALEAQLKAATTGSAATAKASPGNTPVQTPATRPTLASPAVRSSPTPLPRSAAPAAKTLSFEDTEVEGEGPEPSHDDDVIVTPDGVKADGLNKQHPISCCGFLELSCIHPSRC